MKPGEAGRYRTRKKISYKCAIDAKDRPSPTHTECSMMSCECPCHIPTSSPYRESGISAIAYPSKKKPPRLPAIGWIHDSKVMRTTHKWNWSTVGRGDMMCRLCGKPKFAVEMEPCRPQPSPSPAVPERRR